MMAAISAADNNPGADIVIVEKNSVPGKKLSATGNGRCNLSNSSCPHHLFAAGGARRKRKAEESAH